VNGKELKGKIGEKMKERKGDEGEKEQRKKTMWKSS